MPLSNNSCVCCSAFCVFILPGFPVEVYGCGALGNAGGALGFNFGWYFSAVFVFSLTVTTAVAGSDSGIGSLRCSLFLRRIQQIPPQITKNGQALKISMGHMPDSKYSKVPGSVQPRVGIAVGVSGVGGAVVGLCVDPVCVGNPVVGLTVVGRGVLLRYLRENPLA